MDAEFQNRAEAACREDERTCSRCGVPYAAYPQFKTGVCEPCLFDLALDQPAPDSFDRGPSAPAAKSVVGVLGSYQLVEEIGRGGMGIVYRAVHEQTGGTVALKTVLPQHVAGTDALVRFQREVEAATSLHHPHIVPIYEVGRGQDGAPFFSMRFAGGGSLYHLGRKYQGRWRQIAELMVKISKAVQHAHAKGILHRDLKPGNILFTEDQEPMVSDFGLAKRYTLLEHLTQSEAVLGTPNYVSPEQAAGKTNGLTTAADVYGLGAIFFELLTGRPPFVGENPLDVLRQAAERVPDHPRKLVPAIPRALEAICLRCLERFPENRYPSAQALTEDLECWLHGRRVAARPAYLRLWSAIRARRAAHAWVYWMMGLAVVLWMAGRWLDSVRPDASEVIAMSVAVDDLGQDVPLKQVARQVTDELRRRLRKLATVQLRDEEGSVQRSLPGLFDPVTYGRACNAKAVLTGCVRHSGGQVRLVTRLVLCSSGQVLWMHADNLPAERALADVPTVARGIVEDLRSKWHPISRDFAGGSRYPPLPRAEAFYARAMELAAFRDQSDLSAAVVCFRKAADLDPHFTKARSMLAFALLVQVDQFGEMDKLPLAMSTAREALAVDPYSGQAHRVIASCHQKSARFHEALEEFWTALELSPQSAGCCQSLGLCLRDLGRPRQAIPWLVRSSQLDDAHGGINATLGEILAVCGRDQQAEAALLKAIERDHNNPDSLVVLSALRTWQKNFGEARRLCSETRTRFPDNRYGLNLAAWIEFCDGKNAEAERYFQELATLGTYDKNWEFYGAINPDSALAFLAQQTGRSSQAYDLGQKAIKADYALLKRYPQNPRVLHDMAATYAVLGETQKAIELLQASVSAGWAEQRSSRIDPRFSRIADSERFKAILDERLPDIF